MSKLPEDALDTTAQLEKRLPNPALTRSPKSSPVSRGPLPCFNLILNLPIELRTLIWEYAIGCEYIQYYHRARLTPGDAAIIFPFPSNIRDLSLPRPQFQVLDPRKGYSRFRDLRTLFPLTLVSRQVRAETASLMWKINVFTVSAQDLLLFADLVPAHVRAVIKKIGILNNGMLGSFNSNFSALKEFPVLKKIIFVPRGGIKDTAEMQLVLDAVKEHAGKEYRIVRR